VRESYRTELKGKTLPLNSGIPRIVKRFEKAFSDVGLEFHKTRPARLLLSKMAKEPENLITPATTNRMAALFTVINEAHGKAVARGAAPFS
jgi:hypothetical protein